MEKTTPARSVAVPNLQKIAYRLLEKSFGFFLDYNEYRRRIASDGRDGTRVYYAIDYDVIALYLSPRETIHYANFFDGSEGESSCIAMAFLLGDYFFSPSRKRLGLSPITTYLLTETHHEELMDGLEHFVNQASESSLDFPQLDMERLIHITREVLENNTPESRMDRLVEALSTNVVDLLSIYDEALGKFRSLERFSLIRENGLRRLDNVNWHAELKCNPLPDMADAQDRLRMNKYIAGWTLRLRKADKLKKPRNLRNDALALATLQIANEKLSEENIDARICLITGARSIFFAAQEEFASLYLRHPQAFLMDQDFFAPEYTATTEAEQAGVEESRTLKLFDWLNLCLPKTVKEALELSIQGVDLKILSYMHEKTDQDPALASFVSAMAKVERGGKSDQDMINQLKKEIEVHAASVYSDIGKLSDIGSHDTAGKLAKTLLRLFEENSLSEDKLRSAFDSELFELLDRIYIDVGWRTIVRRADGEGDSNLKGVPALCFDEGYEKATEAKDKLIAYLGHGIDFNEGELDNIYNIISGEDPTNYHACLIYAFMFSLRGFWRPASVLAERALQIVDGISDEQRSNNQKMEVLKGREAAYLAAVAKRRLIRDATELDKASVFIEQARKRMSNDETDFSIRFDSEELAVDTRRILLERYCGMISKDFPLPEIHDVMKKILLLIEKALKIQRMDVRDWIIRQSTVNYLNLVVILYKTGVNVQNELAKQNQILGLLRTLLEDRTSAEKDPHACATYLVGSALFSNNELEYSRDLSRFERFLHMHGHMPYDEKRQEIFKEIIDSRHGGISLDVKTDNAKPTSGDLF